MLLLLVADLFCLLVSVGPVCLIEELQCGGGEVQVVVFEPLLLLLLLLLHPSAQLIQLHSAVLPFVEGRYLGVVERRWQQRALVSSLERTAFELYLEKTHWSF